MLDGLVMAVISFLYRHDIVFEAKAHGLHKGYLLPHLDVVGFAALQCHPGRGAQVIH
jgi:hypothetical protein